MSAASGQVAPVIVRLFKVLRAVNWNLVHIVRTEGVYAMLRGGDHHDLDTIQSVTTRS